MAFAMMLWAGLLLCLQLIHACPNPVEPGFSCRCVVSTSLWCRAEYDFDQVPDFIHSDVVLEEVIISPKKIGESGVLLEIQSNAFTGLKTMRLSLQNLQIETLNSGAFQALGSTLTKLELDNNAINSIDEDTFSGIQNINYLDLRENRLKTISTRIFRGLSKLKTLILENNRIETIAVDAFGELTSLEILHLGDNRLSRIGSEISHLPSLKYLYLKGNEQLKGKALQFDQTAFYGMHSLKMLDVSRCALTRPPSEQIHFTRNLTELNLKDNHIENLVFYAFTGVKKLEKLYLGSNKMRWVPSSALKGLSNLEELDISSNEIKRIGSSAFRDLASLKLLDLSSNSIEAITGEPFQGCHRLETLKISSNNIGTLRYLTFRCLDNLRKIVLNSNAFVCDCDMAWLRDFSVQQKITIVGNKLCEYPMEYQSHDIMNFPTRYCPPVRLKAECPIRTTLPPTKSPPTPDGDSRTKDDSKTRMVTSGAYHVTVNWPITVLVTGMCFIVDRGMPNALY